MNKMRRHEFWAHMDANIKAEYIQDEIIYHSPVYGRHWNASTNILVFLIPFVKINKLGRIGVEKVMVRLNRNDYEPDIFFGEKVQQTHLSKSNLLSRHQIS